ncbi:hypothetical protein RRG08_050982 [Elysia crispata]|uniref:Uncharacterized protein n=1 Tax=Elysia crispata TaxID=231223 RepID=A0AAE1CRX2_9GAST|nr:hypothetical protein RRG08_050982 [Elysia crispata]
MYRSILHNLECRTERLVSSDRAHTSSAYCWVFEPDGGLSLRLGIHENLRARNVTSRRKGTSGSHHETIGGPVANTSALRPYDMINMDAGYREPFR